MSEPGAVATGPTLVARIKATRSLPLPVLTLSIHLAHLPEHEGVIKRRFMNRVVASRSSAVSGPHVHLQDERVLVGLEIPQLGHELRSFPIRHLTIVERNLDQHRR